MNPILSRNNFTRLYFVYFVILKILEIFKSFLFDAKTGSDQSNFSHFVNYSKTLSMIRFTFHPLTSYLVLAPFLLRNGIISESRSYLYE